MLHLNKPLEGRGEYGTPMLTNQQTINQERTMKKVTIWDIIQIIVLLGLLLLLPWIT